ncbi:MAG: family 16 glycoside hydrolase [Chloroflexota bacterium]
MQRNAIIITVFAVLICSCTAFGSGLGAGYGLAYWLEDSNTIEEAASTVESESDDTTSSSTPTAYEPEQPVSAGALLFEDDFTTENWDVYSDNDHDKGYDDDQYFILVNVEEYTFWSVGDNNYDDYILEIDTEQLGGSDDNDYGVILRFQDDANFYSFEISGDGFYTFTKYVDNDIFDIIPWQESSVIRQGDSKNSLRVEVVGSEFTFYINDELVDSAIDSEFETGQIGLVAGTYTESGTRIAFDNLRVWAVE